MSFRPSGLRTLLRAQWALVAAQWSVWTSPVGAFVTDGATEHADAIARPTAPPRPDAWRLAVSVRRAAQYGLFRPRCLVRSIALQRLLVRDGMPSARVVVGVRRTAGTFEAHAWVELDGRPLGEDALSGRGFSRLSRVSLRDGSPSIPQPHVR